MDDFADAQYANEDDVEASIGAAFEYAPTPQMILDDDGLCLAANLAARELFDGESNPLEGRAIGEHLSAPNGEPLGRMPMGDDQDQSLGPPVRAVLTAPEHPAVQGLLRRCIEPGRHLLSLTEGGRFSDFEQPSSAQRQQLIGELGQLALGDVTIGEICRRAVASVGPHLGLDTCVFYPSVTDQPELDAHAVWRARKSGPAPVRVSHDEAVSFRKKTSSGDEPIVIPDVEQMPEGLVRDVLCRAGARTAIMAPVEGRDERIGLIVGASSDVVQIGRERAEFLKTFARVLGQAIRSKLDLLRLKESRARLELAMRLGRMSQFEWDVTAGEIEFDAQMARNLGVEPERMPGTIDASFEWVHSRDRQDVEDAVDSVIEGEEDEYEVYARIRGRAGEWRWQLSRGRVVERDDDGRATRIVGFQQDVHDRVVSEFARAELEDQLRQSQKMEALGRLAGGIAHDFNNLLTAISGYAELVRTEVEGTPLSEDVHEIVVAAERAERLTERLLSLSRRKSLRSSVIDINAVIGEFEKMLARILGEDVDFRTELVENNWHVEIDKSSIEQILLNLIVNARDAMPMGGTLTIETDNYDLLPSAAERFADLAPGEYVRLRVSDTGMGMDSATLEKALEPFFTTKEMGGGTGLGLATVYGAVRRAGGSMIIDSAPGDGTTVELLFPRSHQELSQIDSDVVPHARADVGGERILIVEDDEVLLNLMFRVLREQGFDVTAFDHPRDAWAWLTEHGEDLDLLLTDVVMPEIRGTELAEHALEVAPSTNVMFMSGYTADAEFSAWAKNNHVGLIRKPFTPSYLVGRIRESLLQRSSEA